MTAAAAGKNAAKKTLKYLMGKCMPSNKSNAVKIQIPSYEYNDYLHTHFKKVDYLYAHDPDRICKTGDMVLIQSLPQALTTHISHKVVEVIFPLGDITDPITGKKVAASKYRDDIKEVNKLYGASETGFDYDKAPSRGYLEDKRDFTHKPHYKKYYEDPDDPQPYAV